MGDTEHSVKVYIYDITKGLARSMSGPLLGKQLDGVWHTGIVVFDQEFFFGGSGISSCAPIFVRAYQFEMGDTEHSVKVYIYDITKGLARSMSGPLLGKQLDGVWHTGIVVFDQEFFFGGSGISSCAPCGTELGQPEKIEVLGTTQIPFEVFMDYLQELMATTYRPECYHLLDHNCNTFSDEVAQFLTGRNIPSYVTSLPQEVLNTPFGAMLRPMIDAMAVNPGGGTPIAPSSQSGARPAATPTATPTAAKGSSAGDQSNAKKSRAVVYTDGGPSTTADVHRLLDGAVTTDHLKLVDETTEYLAATNPDWGLSNKHINVLGVILKDSSITSEQKCVVASLLQQLFLQEDVVAMVIHDPTKAYTAILETLEKQTDVKVQGELVKGICNFSSHSQGQSWLLVHNTSSNVEVTSSICRHCLLHDKDPLKSLGAALVFNLTLEKVSEDLAIDLGCAIVELLNQALEESAARHAIIALVKCMEFNAEVVALAQVSGVDPVALYKKYPNLDKIINKHLKSALSK